MIYCGSLSRPVYLKETQVKRMFAYDGKNLVSQLSSEAIRNALSYRFAQIFLDPVLCGKFYVPCTPAIEITEIITKSDYSRILGAGWIKVPQEDYLETTKAFQSGKRSAIINLPEGMIRLKGCGNLDQGFTLLEEVTVDPESIEIRGCHFYHTVKRELIITDQISQILKSYGIECGNQSLGFYEFGDKDSLSRGMSQPLQNFCPQLPKYCGVFKTLSDKRLGSHLLQGVQMLVVLLIQIDGRNNDIRKLVTNPSRIEQFEFEKAEGKWHLSQTFSLIRDREITESLDLRESLRQGKVYDMQEELKTNIDTLQFLIQEKERVIQLNLVQDIQELLTSLNVHPEYYQIIHTNLLKLIDQPIDIGLFLLYDRLGYEMGRIKRIFIDNEINWGFYRDHHKDLYHCNAHLNNFIILPEHHHNLLAPLDFDIAFMRNEFISIEYDQDTSSYGKFDERQWNWFQDMERQSIELGIAGVEMIINSIFNEIDFTKYFSPQSKEIGDQLDVLLRDQMRIGFLDGIQLQNYRHQQLYEVHKGSLMKWIIECGLVLSSDVVA